MGSDLILCVGTANVPAMMRLTQVSLWILGLFFVVFTVPAGAQSTMPSDQAWQRQEAAHYRACLDQTQRDAKIAFDDAVSWQGLGGGDPARHCAIVALVALGHYADAAQRLEDLAFSKQEDLETQVRILNQSATTWIAASNPARAKDVASTALTLAPNDQEAYLNRALALGLLGSYWESIDDLNIVLAKNPRQVEALVLRGAAYRQLKTPELALEDLNRALAISPNHPGGLLERGIIYRLAGNKTKARKDWRRLIEKFPDSEISRRAKTNLLSLDSGVEIPKQEP